MRINPKQSLAVENYIWLESLLLAKRLHVLCRAAMHPHVSATHANRYLGVVDDRKYLVPIFACMLQSLFRNIHPLLSSSTCV